MAVKKPSAPKLLLPIVILSLVGIAGVVTTGILKSKPKINNILPAENRILGQEVAISPTITPTPFIETLIQNTLQSTKDAATHIATEKVTEVKKGIVETINKEVSNLTQSQIESLKLQICRDWGVVNISPTNKP